MKNRTKKVISIIMISIMVLVNTNISSFAVTTNYFSKQVRRNIFNSISLLLSDDESDADNEFKEESESVIEIMESSENIEITDETEPEIETEAEVETEPEIETDIETEPKIDSIIETEEVTIESELLVEEETVVGGENDIGLENIVDAEIATDSEVIDIEADLNGIGDLAAIESMLAEIIYKATRSTLYIGNFGAPPGAYTLINTWYDDTLIGITRDLITSVTFASASDMPTSYDTTWNISSSNGLVGYRSGTDIIIYAPTTDTIYLSDDASNLFSAFISLVSINNFNVLDTSDVTVTSLMFAYCRSLTTVDLSNFYTSNVDYMAQMFLDCWALSSLDLRTFDTTNVTGMYRMFDSCTSLTSIDLTSFNTSNVTDMASMFNNCPSLTTIKASTDFVTTSVSAGNDSNMFNGCTSLVGKNGTSYVDRYADDPVKAVNKTYALIDGYNGNLGYFDGVLPPTPPIPPTPHTPTYYGGGTGGGGNGVSGNIINRNLQFVIETPIYENEYQWVYDNQGRRQGIDLKVDSMVAKALLNGAATKDYYSFSSTNDMIRLSGGGLYKVYFNGEVCYFGFDKNGLLMTGFVEQNPRTEIITVNNDASMAIINSAETMKYYLYDGDEINRGKKWYHATTVENTLYSFDLLGRVISSVDFDSVQGVWEYNPVNDKWKFYIPDLDGKVTHYKDGIYNIVYNKQVCQYIFDADGNVVTGFVSYKGKNYYAEETGMYKGAIREIVQ